MRSRPRSPSCRLLSWPSVPPAGKAHPHGLRDVGMDDGQGSKGTLATRSSLASSREGPTTVLRRAPRGEGAYSWHNVHVMDEGPGAVAALVGFALRKSRSRLRICRPASSPYRSVYQGRGYGPRLLDVAKERLRQDSRSGLGLISSDRNEGALRLCRPHGFIPRSSRLAEERHPGNWLLPVRAA